MVECRKCGKELQQQTIVKYGDGGTHKIVGHELFCPNRECDFQMELK